MREENPALSGRFQRGYHKLIEKGKPINYEGAYSPNDWNSVGDIFPPLVHWKVEKGQFKEYEQYDCGPTTAFCPRKG